jgi:ABC-type multidrug transport system ATPase subunit
MQIEIRGLTKIYGGRITALQDVDLAIGPGMFGLLGPNGAGKTTLLRILATLIAPTAGRALVGGFDVMDHRQKWAIKRLLGYLPQELSLYPSLTVAEFLDYIATLKELHDPRRRAAEVARVLVLAGLDGLAGRRIRTLSGGMKRRVGIAQALLGDPQLVIVDEPTAGLDPEERVRFRMLLTRLASDRVVILSTHIVEDVATTCQELAVLAVGQVRFTGHAQALLAAATGQIWEIHLAPGAVPPTDWPVASSVRDSAGTRVRVVGAQPCADAQPATPTLEEAYLALMAQPDTRTVALAQ